MSNGWSWYVIALVVGAIGACVWLLAWARTVKPGEPLPHEAADEAYDGIVELNMPLPRWWLGLFIATIAFSIVYLLLYPGLGNYPGLLGWSSAGQHAAAVEEAQKVYGPIYAKYAATPIPDLAKDPTATAIGQRLFANNCATCHGSDARGGVGFPNLSDDIWKWGATPADIETSILHGRLGIMPAFAPAIGGEEAIPAVTAYVLSLSGKKVDEQLRAQGEQKFKTICVACHGLDGKGNPALGAPNLTDDDWLYGGTPEAIADGLRNGRKGQMPAHQDLLGPERVHLIAAYVYSLSHGDQPKDRMARQ